jgi:hypothetical protein
MPRRRQISREIHDAALMSPPAVLTVQTAPLIYIKGLFN